MYELIILIQLAYSPMHGYRIAKIINDMIGPYGRMSNGRLYPLLATMEQQGLIQADAPQGEAGERHLRTYRITEQGKARLHQLLMDTTSNLGDYRELFAHKVGAFTLLTPAERLRLIEHYLGYCQAHIEHLSREIEDMLRLAASPEAPGLSDRLNYILCTMQHWMEQWQGEIAWAEELRAELPPVDSETRQPAQPPPLLRKAATPAPRNQRKPSRLHLPEAQ
jgi:DNA-binding PadR family transcriptional regulator